MIDRRQFASLLALTGLGATAAGAAVKKPAPPPVRPRLPPAPVKPRRLAEGDTVGMILPATLEFEPSLIDLGREQLEALGLKVKIGAHARDKVGSFAGTDRDRAADIHSMFADPDVRGILCYAGGWGTPRLLPLLDFDLVRRNPKVLVGYSDVTALLNAIRQETGLVTFHGPVAASNLQPYTVDHLRRAVMSTEPLGVLANPEKEPDELVNRTWRTRAIRGGKARGRLAGGNLTLVSSLMGTPWQVDTQGAILLLEDIREAPYRIDRMLTQLALGGAFERVAGVAFGYCTECTAEGPSFSVEEILNDRFAALGVPVLSGLAFGHLKKMLTLPLGLEATLDADAGTLEIPEAAVV
ncbi:MAG TPA: LD-carboxypeptidase [Thermoanaerobaculia bacterium]|nr:LD-carboxypeptidase [Thermoanaerobaculia bacterium]